MFIGGVLSYVTSINKAGIVNWEKMGYLILLTVIIQYLFLAWAFFKYEIYEDKIVIKFPFRVSSLDKVIYLESIKIISYEDSVGGSGYDATSTVKVYYIQEGKANKLNLPLHDWKKRDVAEVLSIFKKFNVPLKINSRHKHIMQIKG